MRNPFAKKQTITDTTPEPGGVGGVPYDWVRWYPPDTPYYWNTEFPHVWGSLYFSQWINQPEPFPFFINPSTVPAWTHIWPGVATSGPGYQLVGAGMGATPQGTTNVSTAETLNQQGHNQADQAAAPVTAFSGGFAKV